MTTPPQDYFPELLKKLEHAGPQTIPMLEKAANEYPRDPRPFLLMAAEFMHANQTDRAEACYIFALHRAPTFAIARFQLGLLQLTNARPAAAIATWAPLELLPDGEPLKLFKRGLEAMAQDKFEDARANLEAGIAANTTNEALNRDMRMVLGRIGARHP